MRATLYYKHWREAVSDPRWLWPNFSPHELACWKDDGSLLVDLYAASRLQGARTCYGKPFILYSAYRTPKHNRRVGGSENSQHMKGTAFDVATAGHEYNELVEVFRLFTCTGIGFYNTFIHVDWREGRTSDNPATWDYRT